MSSTDVLTEYEFILTVLQFLWRCSDGVCILCTGFASFRQFEVAGLFWCWKHS